ncbi:hypothetical protein R70723_09960 [Paenibacillus sp. FSL R7-0273]|uniref:DUF1802 family protein n=1 Tax=Paenibacillus sp. FSL R7-0273 TaxID=1536772 RepID=UPI0004F6FB41|nr:DUF1802 family protein [Paenibacillus sp. FSL R7-0273]AIQ46172.1 hypothetical protein R70723_09960 [Paenibacillus sp. FSL R7-0273]OMF85001.1 hypothetical protein BK144_28985 [Paenibacillus sp. FSL R7-0273]
MNSVALKEWASAIQALAGGQQIILLRKGGIAEETRRFELKSHSFFLYPTYEHQREELLKEPYRQLVAQTMAEEAAAGEGTVRLQVYAEAVEDIEVRDLEQLELLYPFHIWSGQLAAERLRWKAKEPLHVLLLRVYVSEAAVSVPVLDEYSGCRSWIELADMPPAPQWSPVLSDSEFEYRRAEILSVLGS